MRWPVRGAAPFQNTGFPLGAPVPTRRARVPWAIAASLLVLALLLAAALVYLQREALRSGERLAASLAQIIAEQSSRSLQAVDTRLQLASVELQALRAAGNLTEDSARAMLRRQLAELPFVRAIWVVGRDGRIAFDSDTGNIGLALGDRDYFKAHQQNPALSFFVGPPVRSRSVGTWLISASRPLPDGAGAFDGVIVAAIEPPYFQRLWQGLEVGPSGAIALFTREGQLVMRSPPDDAAMGRDFSRLALFRQRLPAGPDGVFVGASAMDAVERVVAYRVLPFYPGLVVTVGLAYDGVLASWRRFALLTAAVWGLAALVAGALAWQLHRQSRRQRRAELQFRELAQAMPQIVFIADAEGKVRFVNQRWEEATGQPANEALGSGWVDLIHPDDRAGALESMGRAVRAGVEVQHEHRLRYVDGVHRWQLLRAVPAHASAGKPLVWYGTSTEIDQLKTAQAQLEGQAALLSVAGRLAKLGGWVVLPEERRIIWSDEASATLDMPPGSSPTLEEVFAMILPHSRERAAHAVQQCIEHGTPFDVEVDMDTATGRRICVRSIGRAVRDAQGGVLRIEGAQQDITERVALIAQIKELNAGLEQKIALRTSELARQEALFRALAEQVPMPIWMVDPEGRATFFSRAWYDLFGGEAPRWHGYRWLELVHPGDVDAMTANWRAARNEGDVYAGTRRLRAKEGGYRTTRYHATPVRNERGAVEFWVGVDVDLTDLMAKESALRLANEQLEAFAYSVSHDLQSPLQRVASFVQLLGEEIGPGAGDKARHYLARIRVNTDNMRQLIEGLLALAEVSQMKLAIGAVNLSDLATEILERMQAEHPDAPLAWRVEPGLCVAGDVRLMRSVMENLLGNAWKFTSRTPRREIVFGGSTTQGEYFVRDNGAGFDMAYADKLFGTFQRLHGVDEFPGTGIGLATVARAIARQGGTIRAAAAPGQGATFTFTLPGAPAH